MLLLDTDHLSLLERGGTNSLSLQIRLGQLPSDDFATTVITYEEQMRGWLAYSAQAKTSEKMLLAYNRLQRHIEIFQGIRVLPFDSVAATQYTQLQQLHIRIGSMDLKIAAICLALDATLLTCNRKDFEKVPGLMMEDWTQ